MDRLLSDAVYQIDGCWTLRDSDDTVEMRKRCSEANMVDKLGRHRRLPCAFYRSPRGDLLVVRMWPDVR